MERLFSTLVAGLLACASECACGMSIKDAYLDKANNVHIVDTDGQDTQVTTTGNILDVRKSTDGATVAWRVADAQGSDPDGSDADFANRGSHQVVVYRDGKTGSIECMPFIRDYWFWKRGTRIGIDCGGMHFAGTEILYDSSTLKQIDSVDDVTVPMEKRPEWSNSSLHFSGD